MSKPHLTVKEPNYKPNDTNFKKHLMTKQNKKTYKYTKYYLFDKHKHEFFNKTKSPKFI